MGTVKDVKDSKTFCDEVFAELSGMRNKMIMLRDRTHHDGEKNEVIAMYERHLSELVEEIEWKIQILAHSCPHDWKGSAEYEENIQVSEAEKSGETGFSPGYLGG